MNMRHLICFGALLSVLASGMPAHAVTSASDPHNGGIAVPPRALLRAASQRLRSGVITNIDLGRNIIVIGSVEYTFAPALTKVHSADPLVNGNPLKLAPGQTVRFRMTERPGQRPQVVEVFL